MENYKFDGNLIPDKDCNFERARGIVYDKDGNEKTLEVLFTFECEELNKEYAILTDWSYTDKGELRMGVYSYTEKDGKMANFIPVEDKDELLMAQDVIDDSIAYIDEMSKKEERK